MISNTFYLVFLSYLLYNLYRRCYGIVICSNSQPFNPHHNTCSLELRSDIASDLPSGKTIFLYNIWVWTLKLRGKDWVIFTYGKLFSCQLLKQLFRLVVRVQLQGYDIKELLQATWFGIDFLSIDDIEHCHMGALKTNYKLKGLKG